jgi:hypothetical protein
MQSAAGCQPSFQIKLTILGTRQECAPLRFCKNKDRAPLSILRVANCDMAVASKSRNLYTIPIISTRGTFAPDPTGYVSGGYAMRFKVCSVLIEQPWQTKVNEPHMLLRSRCGHNTSCAQVTTGCCRLSLAGLGPFKPQKGPVVHRPSSEPNPRRTLRRAARAVLVLNDPTRSVSRAPAATRGRHRSTGTSRRTDVVTRPRDMS